MKIFVAILATAVVAGADHQSLRHATTERVLNTEDFNQGEIVAATESPNRNEPCIPGQFDQNTMVIDAQKKQFPTDVAVGQQCRSSCDCAGRCCSNYPYYISLQSSSEGFVAGKGGVCIDAFESGYTNAATRPTCGFGLFNQADDSGELPGPPLDDPTVGEDSGEGGPIVIQPVIDPEPVGCNHNGVNFAPGQTYANKCNGCECRGLGLALCSLEACDEAEPECDFKGMKYWDGEKFMDDCNTCTCSIGADGPMVSCSLRACPPPVSPAK